MTYIVAEIGGNHEGSMLTAKRLIDEAKIAGVNAVKFQGWTPESLYAQEYLDANHDLYNQLRVLSFDDKRLAYLSGYAKPLDFICSVFSRQEVDELESIVDLYKVASMDLNNTRLLKYIANKKKPVILSVGMGEEHEISAAVEIFKHVPLTLLHCVSLYPPQDHQIGLGNLEYLKKYGVNVGYSDHTENIVACLIAVSKGAQVIEKHFTLDKSQEGWDHKISADPEELQFLVDHVKSVEEMTEMTTLEDIEQRKTMRRSIVSVCNQKKGYRLKNEDVIYRRPGTGLPIGHKLGKLKRDVRAGQILTEEDL